MNKYFISIIIIVVFLLINSCTKSTDVEFESLTNAQCYNYDEELNSLSILSSTSSNSVIQKVLLNSDGPDDGVGEIRRVALFSTTYIPIFELLNMEHKVCAIDDSSYSNSEWLQKEVEEKRVIEIGSMQKLDFEKLLLARVDAIFTPKYVVSPSLEIQLKSANIRVFYFQEWLENSPISRASWIKVAALLLGCKDEGEKKFNEIKKRYIKEKNSVNISDYPPVVLTSLPFQGSWGVPGGESYLARLIKDAGGITPWNSNKQSGSLMLDPEVVIEKAISAEIWLINSYGKPTIEKLLKKDPLYHLIPAISSNRVYNHSKRINIMGGNDIFESGIINPDLVLKDLKEIISATTENRLVNREALYYYEQTKK